MFYDVFLTGSNFNDLSALEHLIRDVHIKSCTATQLFTDPTADVFFIRYSLRSCRDINRALFLFGKEDPLYLSQYERFVSFANKFSLPAVCEAWEGGRHDFEFWEPAMKKAMEWLKQKTAE